MLLLVGIVAGHDCNGRLAGAEVCRLWVVPAGMNRKSPVWLITYFGLDTVELGQ